WPTPSAARATRKATSAATTETFDVMTKCSSRMTTGWLCAGSPKYHASRTVGRSVATMTASGRTGGILTQVMLVADCLSGGGDARDLRQELAQVERLLDDVRGGECFGVRLQVSRCREQHERDVLIAFIAGPQRVGELPSVHHRHHEIQHDHIRSERLDDGERFLTVPRRNDLKTLVLEGGEQQLPDVGVVVHNEHTFPGHRAVDCHTS